MKIVVFQGGEVALKILTGDDGVFLWHMRGLDVGVLYEGEREEGNYTTVAVGPYIVLLAT